MINYNEKSLLLCEENKGKICVVPKTKVTNKEELSSVYTPGVAAPCLEIKKDKHNAYKYTIKSHTIGIVSDGTAVLGLGDIGPEAAMPVMEGKSILFKEFGGVDCVPICLNTKDTEEIIKTVKYLAPSFGGFNLEDISAPRCFEIERRLIEELDIPVFHDDQHGTAIVSIAALINALKIVKKEWKDVSAVINGAGAAGLSICNLLIKNGIGNVVVVDSKGIVNKDRTDLNSMKQEIAAKTNKNNESGTLQDAIKGKDVFIGVSVPNVLTKEMIATMNKDAIVFALANPTPEIMPSEAKAGGARIVATGRSDFPNQVNNVLVFPGLFKGALMVESTKIVDEMKLGAAKAIASLVTEEDLNEDHIIPDVFDRRVADVVSIKVAEVAEKLGIAKNPGNRKF